MKITRVGVGLSPVWMTLSGYALSTGASGISSQRYSRSLRTKRKLRLAADDDI